MVARNGVCLMPVGFPARLPAGRIGHIAVRSGDMVRAGAITVLGSQVGRRFYFLAVLAFLGKFRQK